MRHAPAAIALFGTFDVENYGDLLFPHLVRRNLCAEGDVLTAFSPVGGSVAWTDALPAEPLAQAGTARPDLCVIGGGNIVSAEPTPLPAYAPLGEAMPFAYAGLWLGAAAVAAESGCPLVWNAPGLPRALGQPWARELADLALAASDYVAVRDAQSLAWLGPRRAANVVPDVALGISDLWTAQELAPVARAAFLSRGHAVPQRWIAFHVNDRYLPDGGEVSAAIAARIAAAAGAVPVLLAIGPCHGDDALARWIGPQLGPCLVVDRAGSLKEIAALIAGACGYVGSSMHGLITALSYGRPALAVARTAMPKFRGFLDQVAMPDRLVESWSQAEAAAPALLAPIDAAGTAGLARARRAVAGHWTRMRACLDRPDPGAAEGRQRLRAALAAERPSRWQWMALRNVAAARPIPCPICRGTTFDAGPGGRLSRSGRPPRCTTCGSLERHRIFRLVFDAIRTDDFGRWSCLAFSDDRSLSPDWFAGYELSLYEARNSLDVQAIDRPDASYDVVVCNHVLEHVPDYRAGLRELARITHPGGFAFISFPSPVMLAHTVDWGYPREDQHGHYRLFGRDVEAVFATEIPQQRVIAVGAADPITGVEDFGYLLTRSAALGEAVCRALGAGARLVQAGTAAPDATAAAAAPRIPPDEVATLAEALRGPTLPDIGERLAALVRSRPREPRPRLLLGEWLGRCGRLDEAEACLRAAMDDFPGNPWPAFRLARLHLLRGDPAAAGALFDDRLAAGPLPEAARRELARDIAAARAAEGSR